MEWIRWILGSLMFAAGGTVCVHGLWRFRRDHGAAFAARFSAWREARRQAADLAAEAAAVQQAEEVLHSDFFVTSTQIGAVRYDDIPLRQTGRDQHYDLQIWARMVAWLIYSRLVPGVSGQIGSPLNPTMFKTRIGDAAKAARFAWVRLFADEAVCASVRTYYNLDAFELDQTLRTHLLDVLEGFFEPDCHAHLQEIMVVNVFEENRQRGTCFSVDFLPLLPRGDEPLACDAYLLLGTGQGRITVPAPDNYRIEFADQVLALRQGYYPLLGDSAGLVEIGPGAHCHIQTHKQHCVGSLELGWRDTAEIGIGGILEIRKLMPVKGERFFLRRRTDTGVRDHDLIARTRARLPIGEEGKQTTCEIWRCFGGEENLLLTLVMRNRRPPLDSLPDCCIFEDAFEAVDNARDLARFLAGQMYFATKRQKNIGDILWLDGPIGKRFFSDPDAGGPVVSRGRKRTPVRCRIKVCVSPARLHQVHEWLGDRDMPRRLAALILDVLDEDEVYRQAFPAETRGAFLPGEGAAGLTVEIADDSALGPDTVLVRCLPAFVPNRRREIFGRLWFDTWPGARDRSDFSCKDGLTFFTDYPSGVVALHLSRFPVYEVQTPGIFGAVTLHIIEAGTPGARLKVDNHSSAAVVVDGKTLLRPASHTVETGGRDETRVRLDLGERALTVDLFGEPVAQADEPYFVPEPAKLELYGLTMHRRPERTGWESARGFRALWDAASIHENKTLRGISQVTDDGYLAVVERGAGMEHHFFAGRPTRLNGELHDMVPAGGNTLGMRSLPGQVTIWEEQATDVQVAYHRLDFADRRILNAGILTFDYWDYWIDALEPLLGEGERVTRVELARCMPGRVEDRDAHLYLVETALGDDTRRGWLWHADGGIQTVRPRGAGSTAVTAQGPLVGPFHDVAGKLFLVDWVGEVGTPVSFDLEDHEDQVRRYLADGYFSLPEDAPFNVGGKLGGDRRIYKSSDPLFINSRRLHLDFDQDGTASRPGLNFNPRDMAVFFDKESFSIYYSGDAQAFVISSVATRKKAITPKTVFLIIPEGGHAVLGSHALSPLKIPAGVNTLVLPGLTFKLSQGPVYYA